MVSPASTAAGEPKFEEHEDNDALLVEDEEDEEESLLWNEDDEAAQQVFVETESVEGDEDDQQDVFVSWADEDGMGITEQGTLWRETTTGMNHEEDEELDFVALDEEDEGEEEDEEDEGEEEDEDEELMHVM